MGKKVLIGFLIIVVVFAVVVALQPDEFRVSRSVVISAAPAQVFSHVNNFHHWENWSPWAKIDPNAKSTYAGPDSGEGAIFSWASENKEVGEGKMTLVKSVAAESILIQLEFVKPMKTEHMAEFSFKPEGQGTLVTWSMFGKKNFFFKAMQLFMNCDKMVGPYFEKGLSQLKSLVESTKSGK